MVQVLEKIESIEQLFDKYIIIIPEKEEEKQEKEIKKNESGIRKKKAKLERNNKNKVAINAIKAKNYSNLYQSRSIMF